jgi:uncharacterized protein (DUF58 family)
MRQVVWKKVARSGEMVSRETAGTAARELWLDWADTAGGDVRKAPVAPGRLGAAGRPRGPGLRLRLPQRALPPGQGDAHRRAALDLLAEHAG